LIFLRPRIIRVSGDMDEPTRKKYEYLDELSVEQNMRQDDDALPPLEEWDYIAPMDRPAEEATGGAGQ
jgi:type II secretory pathway component GspD/PulD (secretin)